MSSKHPPLAKRFLDLLIAVPALLILWPLMLVVAVAVRWGLGSPVFYRQQRPGLNEEIFGLLKFRTMTNARDSEGRLLPDSQRLGQLGALLRRYSLDELPQLLNVLKGEMSLVGPRPLLVRYLDRYTPEQRRRHDVVPGITGWSQIHGRNALTWEEKFALDIWYVDHASVWLDLQILFLTLGKVVRAEGVMEQAGAVFSEFWGVQGPPPGGVLAFPAEANETRGGQVGSSPGDVAQQPGSSH